MESSIVTISQQTINVNITTTLTNFTIPEAKIILHNYLRELCLEYSLTTLKIYIRPVHRLISLFLKLNCTSDDERIQLHNTHRSSKFMKKNKKLNNQPIEFNLTLSFMSDLIRQLIVEINSNDQELISLLAMTSKDNMEYILNYCGTVSGSRHQIVFNHVNQMKSLQLLAKQMKLFCQDNIKYLISEINLQSLFFSVYEIEFKNYKNICIHHINPGECLWLHFADYRYIRSKSILFSNVLKQKYELLNNTEFNKVSIDVYNIIDAQYFPTKCNSLIIQNTKYVVCITNLNKFESSHIRKFKAINCHYKFYTKDNHIFHDKMVSYSGPIDGCNIYRMCNLISLCVYSNEHDNITLDLSSFTGLQKLTITSKNIIPINIPLTVKILKITLLNMSRLNIDKLINLEYLSIHTNDQHRKLHIPKNLMKLHSVFLNNKIII